MKLLVKLICLFLVELDWLVLDFGRVIVGEGVNFIRVDADILCFLYFSLNL